MKLIAYLLFGLISINIQLSAQDMQFPKGAYMSFQEITSKSPSRQYNLIVERRTMGDIKMNGGNDFKLVSPDNSVVKSILKKEIWGYSLGDTLYLNGFQYKFQSWYADVISDGKYLVFKGGLSQYVDEQKRQMQMGYMFGAVGGAIQGAYLATLRFLYVIDKESNKIFTVTPEKMEELLQSNNELLVKFKKEVKKEDEILLINYLKLFNEESNK